MGLTAHIRFIDGDTELFTYEDTLLPHYDGFEFKLGDAILGLLYIDEAKIKNLYTDLMMDTIMPCLDEDFAALESIRARFNEIDLDYPCLYFYTHLLYYCMGDVFNKEVFEIKKDLSELYSAAKIFDDPKFALIAASEISKNEENLKLFFEYAVEIVISDINQLKKTMSAEVDRIHECSLLPEYETLTPAQRLYFLDYAKADKKLFNYSSATFTTAIIINKNRTVFSFGRSAEEYAAELQETEMELVEAYELHRAYDWMMLEQIKLILADLPYRICGYCGKYFIVRGRRDVKYCDRIPEGEIQPCEEIGAIRVYQNKITGDPIHRIFNTAYKRMSSRLNYQKCKISPDEFYDWSERAREMRQKCLDGEITLEEFNTWLGNKPLRKKEG